METQGGERKRRLCEDVKEDEEVEKEEKEEMEKEEVEVKEKEQECFLVKASQVLASCSHNRVLGRQPSLHRPIPGQ